MEKNVSGMSGVGAKQGLVSQASIELNTDKSDPVAATTNTTSTTAPTTTATAMIPLYYELRIKLKEGRNLAIRDIGG